MEDPTVGTSGLSVSRLGLGTMTWARITPIADARAMLRALVEAGGTWSTPPPPTGRALPRRSSARSSTPTFAGGRGHRHEGRLRRPLRTAQRRHSRGAMLDDLAASLRRLHTDHVDLWQVHAWGDAPLEETLAAMDHAVSSGMARYAGISSNFIGWQTARAATWQQAVPNRTPLVSGQVEYSLLARRAEIEVLPAPAGARHGFVPLVTDRTRRPHRQVPQRAAARLARSE